MVPGVCAWSWGVPGLGGGSGPGGCLVETIPQRLLLWAVCILLECILVNICEHFNDQGSHFFGLTKFHDISMIFP